MIRKDVGAAAHVVVGRSAEVAPLPVVRRSSRLRSLCSLDRVAAKKKAQRGIVETRDLQQGGGGFCGIGDAELVSAAPVSAAFGDTLAVFLIRPLLVRFIRDRGEVFVDLANQSVPEIFHQVDDIGIAMGWWSVTEVLSRSEPVAIGAVLQLLKANFDAIRDAFSGDRERLTRARVERAARERGEAFVAGLRGTR